MSDGDLDQTLEPLEKHLNFIREVCGERGDPQEVIDERIRFAELLWIHARAGWVQPMFITRAVNMICNPEAWEEWKKRGGDPR